MGSCRHDGHLRPVPVGDEMRGGGARRGHDREQVVDPALHRASSGKPSRHADPAHVEPDHTGKLRQPLEKLHEGRLLTEHLEVAPPIEHENKVRRPMADHLEGDVDVAFPDVLRLSERHERG
jgi:hypothetical protein